MQLGVSLILKFNDSSIYSKCPVLVSQFDPSTFHPSMSLLDEFHNDEICILEYYLDQANQQLLY